MYDFILIENLIAKTKGICLQVSLSNNLSFLYSIFNVQFKLLEGAYYFYFNLNIFGDFFSFDFQWSKETDHAGFLFGLTVLGFMFHFNIYDIRHWNFDNNCWEEYIEK